jgi:magnesium-transporting ATPase (P-type)
MTDAVPDAPIHHTHTAEQTLADLATSSKGLSRDEAGKRQARYGSNLLPEAPRQSSAKRFALQFHNLLIYVLLASSLATALLGHWTDSGVILAVVLANAVIGFIQEGKAEKAMDAIRQMLAPKASVIRDGERTTVDGSELVPGDIVILEAGDRVPADCRLLQVHGLSVQEAVLTGESVPVEKQLEPVALDAALGDRSCMVYSSTLVAAGQGKAVVVATGAATEIGRVSNLLARVETLTTPLIRQMAVFARWLTLVILLIGALLLIFGYTVSAMPFSELFMVIVGLSVAAIPEGLPAVLTITLAVGVQAMARRNAIVRRLPAIEALGSVSVICTDKTGTLTRNEMMVASAWVADGALTVTGSGYAPDGGVHHSDSLSAPGDHANPPGPLVDPLYPPLPLLARTCALCNDAALHDQGGNWSVDGDPMEGALLSFAVKSGWEPQTLHSEWRRTDTIPFDARHRYMATLHHNHQGEGVVLLKGAPEKVIALCRAQIDATGAEQPINPTHWLAQVEHIAAQGQRVLAMAYRPVAGDKTVLEADDLDGHMVLLGLVGLIDPPRPEAISAIAECREAGVRVKMITGDHAGTAAAIGRQIGLQNADTVMTGSDLDALDEAQLRAKVMDCDIYARTSPEHKLRLVTALQSHGLSVAMTGDGVNDAPALKRADAGIAMGLKGSAAAKEAAEVVLADDNFATIVAAIREGRTVYDNVKKVISWTLPTSAGEAMTIIVALLAGMALPITAVQILWVNLITAVTLGIALAFEPTEKNAMRRPPRRADDPILNRELAWQIVWISALFLAGVFGVQAYAADRGYSAEVSHTLAMNTLVVMEIFNLFFIRNIYSTSFNWQAVRGTRIIWLTILVVTVAQFAVTYLPPFQRVLGTAAVSLTDGVLVVAIGAAVLCVCEIEKQVRLRLRKASLS